MMGFGYRFMAMGICSLVILAVLVLIIVGIIALVRYLRSLSHLHQAPSPGINTALQILNERYARSEISDEEYRTKRSEIEK